MISVSPTEVEHRFALLGIPNRFAEEEKVEPNTTLVTDPNLQIVGFPVPKANSGLNILNLRRLLGTNPVKQPSFYDHPWYLDETFVKEDCSPGWHFLTSGILPDSISMSINYASSLEKRNLILPSAIEIVLLLFLHFAGTGEQLLQKKHTWCRDNASLNRFVTVGAFGRNGLFISAHPGEYSSRGLGICAKVTP